jgi:hypothetical protein
MMRLGSEAEAKPVRPHRPRIRPANVADLPTVLDTEQAANVLRMSIERVRAYTGESERHLRRLKYTREYLYDVREVLRFLEVWTDEPESERRAS